MTRLWMIGCGNMGGAMLRRWLDTRTLAPADVTVVRPSGVAPHPGIRTLTAPPADEAPPDVLLLGVKPQLLDAVAPAWRDVAAAVLVSILAGVEQAALVRRFPATTIVRAMPNLPVALGKGVVALAATDADEAVRAGVTRLMAPLGLVEWVDEARLDLVTALAGSGPAFLYRVIDALAAAAADLGLDAAQAARMALATVEGAAALAAGADAAPATLAERVASRGGSTRAGLDVLDRDDALLRLLRETLAAAARRNAELAAAAR